MNIGLDLDGTLITCRERHCALITIACRQMGVTIDSEAYWEYKRKGASNRYALKYLGFSDELAEKICALWGLGIENFPWLLFDKVMSGTHEALSNMRAAGHKLHLVTARKNKPHAFIQLRLLRLRDHLTTVSVTTGHNSALEKNLVFKKHDISCFLGDSESDHAAAEEAGIPFAAVTSGMRDIAFLSARGIKSIFPDIQTALADWNLLL